MKTSKLKVLSLSVIAGTLLFLSFNYAKSTSNVEKLKTEDIDDSIFSELKANLAIPSLDVKSNIYTIDSKTGGEIIHTTGSEIIIPAESFVSKLGKKITGKVKIHYREFHNQFEILGSGVTMEYDSAGENMVFESAGMLEIYGIQNGDTLEISPDKEIAISMKSHNSESRFNLYYLDQNKTWINEGKDSISVGNGDLKEAKAKLKTTDLACDEQKEIVKTAQKEVKKIQKTEPEKPKEANPEKPSFEVDFLEGEFPELATYSGTIFELVNENEYKEDIYETEWEGLALKQNKDKFNLELTQGDTKKTLKVIPVLDGENYAKALKKFKAKFKSYSEKLEVRLKDEADAEKELGSRIAEQKKQRALIKKMRERFKREQDQLEVTRNFGQANSKTAKQVERINRHFKINKTGYWNSDQPLPRGNKRIIVNKIKDDKNKILQMNQVSVLELSRNRVINIVHWEQLRHDPKTRSIMIGVSSDNEIVYSQELNSIKGNTIKVKKLGPTQDLDQIKHQFLN